MGVNILHLSDLHFGAESTESVSSLAIAKRKNTLGALIEALKSVEAGLRPDIVVVSGDIAWKGNSQDYCKAKIWLQDLLKVLELTTEELILCAGNHDINEKMLGGLGLPESMKQADEWLDPGQPGFLNLVQPFQNYISFCEDFHISKLSLGNEFHCLVGQRKLRNLRFVVLNSAWFCRRKFSDGKIDDNKKLWLGLPHLIVMKANDELIVPTKYDESAITIAVHHHPPEWLHDSELNAYEGRNNTYQYLAERCHIVLSGHAHPGAVQRAMRWSQSALVFKGGATYVEANYLNFFSILKIDSDERSVSTYYYNFLSAEDKWVPYYGNPMIESLRKYPLRTLNKKPSFPSSGYRVLYRDEDTIREICEQISEDSANNKHLSDYTILDLMTLLPVKSVKQTVLQIESQTHSTPVEDLINPGMRIDLYGSILSQDDISPKNVILRIDNYEFNVALENGHSLKQAMHILQGRTLHVIGIIQNITAPIIKAAAIILK